MNGASLSLINIPAGRALDEIVAIIGIV